MVLKFLNKNFKICVSLLFGHALQAHTFHTFIQYYIILPNSRKINSSRILMHKYRWEGGEKQWPMDVCSNDSNRRKIKASEMFYKPIDSPSRVQGRVNKSFGAQGHL